MRSSDNNVIPAFEKLIASRIVLTTNDAQRKNNTKLKRTEYLDLRFIHGIFRKTNLEI